MALVQDKGLFIRVKGVPTVLNALGRIADDVERNLAIKMVAVVEKVGGDAKKFAPVDTGFLKANIKGSLVRQRSLFIGRIISHAPYSINQEFGLTRNRYTPYMIPALKANKEFIVKTLGDAVRSVIVKLKGKSV